MGFLKKKIRIAPEAFINHEANKALTQKTDDLRQLITASKVDISSTLELTSFAAFLTLLAMTLARLHENIQKGYVGHVGAQLDANFGAGAGERFSNRTLEYLEAFDKDVSRGRADVLPATMALALDKIIGRSDASVAFCRLGLLKFVVPSLRVNVELFKELKFI